MTPSGTSSTSLATYSASDENPRAMVIMDMRMTKRMISNRESARRSRMRKQKRLNDLAAEAGLLVEENQRVRAILKVVAEGYTRVKYENSVLRAQMEELGLRRFGSDSGYKLLTRDFACNNQIC